ncbi:MltA domain-containing protein [Deltaproteobacteria bacterium TL4]
MHQSIFQSVCLFLLAVILQSCSLFVPSQAVLEPLSPEEVKSYLLEDDQDFELLPEALEASINYYRRLPDSYKFDYAGTLYTAREMEASMNLFLEILDNYEGEQRLIQIQQKFQFYESKNTKGQAFFTGYYEPLLEGSLTPTAAFNIPLYSMPADLITTDLGLFYDDLKGRRLIGKIKGNRLIPYDTREQIAYKSSLNSRAEIILYLKNHIELFFLQIQGSGLVKLPDETLQRVNYAGQNGHPYKAIGALLKEHIPLDEMSLQAIKAYLYSHPDEVRRILNHNPSYTFFREVEDGPLGNIEVPLTPGRSLAMDRQLIPRGGLAFIETIYPPLNEEEQKEPNPLSRFMVVQDTGGAIRGHGRADVFWGHGREAEIIAGHMKQHGRIILLVARKEILHPQQTSATDSDSMVQRSYSANEGG